MGIRSRALPLLALALLLHLPCMAGPPDADAHATPTMPVIDFPHASWTAREGAPPNIHAIAQTPDGWIWIASASGLYRFDGVRFLPATGALAPLAATVSDIGALPDGTLWITYDFGGLSLMKDGRMRHYRPGESGLPDGSVYQAIHDGTGRLWISNAAGLHYLDADGRWRQPAPASNAPAGAVVSLALDRFGAMWALLGQGAWALPKGADRFEQKTGLRPHGPLVQHPDGSLWMGGGDEGERLHMLVGPAHGPAPAWHLSAGGGEYLFDHAGQLWIQGDPGVLHVGPDGADGTPAQVQRTAEQQGLSGNLVYAIFEDREQNVWIGTENGLDRFRAPRLRAQKLPTFSFTNARPLAGGPGAAAWIDQSYLAGPGADARPLALAPAPGESFVALHRGPGGALWAASRRGQVWADLATHPYPLPDLPGKPGGAIYSMAQDTHGALWVTKGARGLYAWRDGRWSERGGGIAELASFAATTVAADGRGRVWLGSTNNRLALLENGKVRRYGAQDGLAVGAVEQVLPAGPGAWVGGQNGLAYFDGRRFTAVTGKGGDAFTGIQGLVFGRDGTLWIHGIAGISSVAPDELRRLLRQPGYQVQFRRLDHRDGLSGAVSQVLPVPSAVRSDDGTLWFSTTGGVFAFDPATLPRNPLAPPVAVTALRAGAGAYEPVDGAVLPAGTEMLQVDFTALSYREPERMAFRYRLEGVDRAWRDGGRERSAYYTNLGPGHYRFRVIAANDDGVWNTDGAAVSFDIAPTLTQTPWFRILCVSAALLLAWRLQVLWTRRSARRLAARMSERVAERERIARELHDTLLQSVQGLIMLFWSTAARLAPQERAPVQAAIERAKLVVAEGRDLVAGLRTAAVADGDLAGALRRYGEPLAREGGVAFALSIDGRMRKLQVAAADEIFAIAREAVWNAVLHAQAQAIAVTLQYTAQALVVTVADDGKGLPANAAENGHARHWGIPGMHERARTLGAALDLDTAPSAGTRWTLRVPAAIAFA